MNSPSGPDDLVRQAIGLHQARQLAQAEALYVQALALRPAMPEIIVNLGLAQLGQNKQHAAVETFGRAIAVDPSLAKAHFHMGNALALGRFDRAVPAFEAAARIQPGHADAHNNLGNASLCRREDAGAKPS